MNAKERPHRRSFFVSGLRTMSDEQAAKLGARNNRSDKDRIRGIRKQAREIEAITKEMEPEDEDAPAKGADLPGVEDAPVIVGSVVAIKAEGDEWALDVLGVPFGGHNGGKDSDGEFFSQQTKLYLDKYPTVPCVFYHGYDEHGRPHGEPQFIGKTTGHTLKQDGVWFRVILDKASAYAKRVWEAAKQGIAKASSGSIAHLVRKGQNGHITHWPVAELSIFDTGGKRQPANQYAVALPVLKAIYQEAGIPLPDDITPSPEKPEAESQRADRTSAELTTAAKTDLPGTQTFTINHGVLAMNEEMKQAVNEAVAAALKAKQEADDAAAKRQKEIDDAVAAAKKEAEEKAQVEIAAAKAEAAEARRLNTGGAAYVTQFHNIAAYDDLEAVDLAVAYGVLDAAKSSGRSRRGVSEDLMRALAVRIVEDKDEDGQFRTVKAQMARDLKGTALKANELNQSTLTSYGDEWIGVTYSTQLWEKIRLDTPIVGRIPTTVVPQGSESVIIPLEGTAPTFYKVAQASAQAANPGAVTETITTSKLGTANQTLTVAKLGAASTYTGELEEDSLIPWASELRRGLTLEAAEVLEHIVLDGDTATSATTNINDIGGTPAGNEAFLLLNGFRKLPLVTNTGNSRSAGTLTVEDFLETVKLMGLAGRNAVDKRAVSLITDMWTHWKTLELAEVKTRDVFVSPTIENGMLTNIYGYQVMVSSNMHRANQDATYGLKANTSGKVDLDTASNNTTGSILAVRWDQWRFGYKRRMTFEVERHPLADSTSIIVQMRVGMIYRDTEASAISYNITL